MAPPVTPGTRYQVLGMRKAGKRPKEISRVLNIALSSVYDILKRARERNEDLETKKIPGRPASKLTKANIDRVRKRVQRDPTKSLRALARDLNFDVMTTIRLVHRAGFKSVSKLVVHELMPGQQERRLARAQELLVWYDDDDGVNKQRVIIWTDEKNFVLQLHHNRKNDRILVPIAAHDPNVRLVKRRKNPSSVMVFAAVGSDGSVMPPIFIPAGVTVNSASYQELVLPKLKTWMMDTYGPFTGFMGKSGIGKAVLMQDGAPPHTSNSTQGWLRDNFGENNFWDKSRWPPSSPDANPLDFSFWNALAAAATGPTGSKSGGSTVPQNRAALIRRLQERWEEVLEPSYVRKTCQSAWNRLRRIVACKGGYIERIRTAPTVEEDDVDENNNSNV